MASTRIIATLRSTDPRSTRNRQIPEQPFYSRQDVEPTTARQKANQLRQNYRGDNYRAFRRAFILRYHKRFEPNCDAGLGTRRGSLPEFSNPRQAHCEPIPITRRAWPDELGGSSSVSRVSTRRMDIRHGDRLVKERALSSFHWVYQLVATPE